MYIYIYNNRSIWVWLRTWVLCRRGDPVSGYQMFSSYFFMCHFIASVCLFKVVKQNPRSLELVRFQKPEILVTYIQILIYSSTFIQTKDLQFKSFRDQNRFNLLKPISRFKIDFPERSTPIAFGVSFDLNFQSQSHLALFNGTWQKRPSGTRLRFEHKFLSKCIWLYRCNSDFLCWLREIGKFLFFEILRGSSWYSE